MSNYNANNIVSLSAGAAFRTKIGMYLSADRQEAINLGLRELIVNVQDEFEVYKPKNPYLKVTLNSTTKEITCEDNMRGIPCGIRDDGINSLTAAFLIPHSGGKHEDGAYSSAIGINGEGNKCVCHTAKWLDVIVKRDGNIYHQHFTSTSEGATATCDVEIIGKTKETGTLIRYVADPEVYGDIFINYNQLREMLREISLFTKGLKISLKIDDNEEEIFYSEKGLIDGLKSENVLSKPFQYFYETPDCKVELALQWVAKGGNIRGYANGLYMPAGGAFISGFKSSLTRTFNNLSNSSFGGEQIRNILTGFVSVKVRKGEFSNQSKTALANSEARTATSAAITQCLKDFSISRKKDFEQLVELLNKVERAERAAEKAREAVLSQSKETEKETKKQAVLAGKLADCRYHNEKSKLLILEGDSALGAIVKARNSDYIAAIPLRGKIINVLKNSQEKMKESDVLRSLHNVLGCGYGEKFNMKKLRYGSIVLVADVDQDGFSIMCLLLCFFYKFYPELLEAGKIYWGKTPLFKVESGKKFYYAYDELELANLPKGDITRAKGIGELEPIDFQNTLFSKDGEYIQFTIEDAEKASYFFDVLMGENIEARRVYIAENADFDAFD